jgi:hypothetical protein
LNGRAVKSEVRWPQHVLILDTETTTDTAQRLLFGCYQHCKWKSGALVCLEEGLIYGDDLPRRDPKAFERLRDYVAQHESDSAGSACSLKLLSRTEFVAEKLWRVGYKARALIVGFNLPFDLSRIAVDAAPARGKFRGGFSLELWRRPGRTKRGLPHPYRPRLRIQHVDSKCSFMAFGSHKEIDKIDQRPAGGLPPDPAYVFTGHFLDLRTLAFALTGEPHSLASACRAFGVKEGKDEAKGHGEITEAYIDYNRQDVRASAALLEALREEYDRHPIDLPATRAYSSASIAKAYFHKMGLALPRQQFSRFKRERLGQSMSAFFGGRAECRIRKAVVPVVYTDFTSMYPTIQCLMGLWDVLTAETVRCVTATREVKKLLAEITLQACFNPDTWPQLQGFALVVPDGDILPARARYQGSEWNVGVNPLYSETPLWLAIPDLVASVLLTGKAPTVIRAFLLVPEGKQDLQAVRLRGEVKVDPRQQNLFQAVIEARQRAKRDESLPDEERGRMEHFLKIFANAGSYGVFVEMNRKEMRSDDPAEISVYGRDGRFSCHTTAPEDPGAFTFPPVASLITAGARLMLATLERCVTDAGGTYAFADTDSMAIVAAEDGGLVACEGGPERLSDGSPGIRALSWQQVRSIVDRYRALNPYDRRAVPGSILKVEKVNFDEGGNPRELQAWVISAKRYALFTVGRDGQPVIHGYSEHGLGHLLNPVSPESADRDWMRVIWEGLVREALGGPPVELPWGDVPAIMRSSVTTPGLLARFDGFNRAKQYPIRVKPFGFLLAATVDPRERPEGLPVTKGFQLIHPYSRNPTDWLKFKWIDLYSRKRYRVRTRGHTRGNVIRVQTFADVIERYRDHPESKSADSSGTPAQRWTVGLLARRPVTASLVLHIGKETNLLEQQQEGVLEIDPQEVYLSEADYQRLQELIGQVSIPKLAAASGVSERMLRYLRDGSRRPSPAVAQAILGAVGEALGG